MTQRVINAIKTGNVNIIRYSKCRLINEMPEYDIDRDEVTKYCEKYKTAPEINSLPKIFGLNDENILKTSKYNIYYSVNIGSHNIYHHDFMELGIGTARRGWITKTE